MEEKQLEGCKSILEANGYQMQGELGEGTQAKVVLVEHNDIRVACKISRNVVHLKREGELLKMLRHPGVPAYIGLKEYDAGAFLLMEYVEGESLAQYLRNEASIHVLQILSWGRELAEVLCALHDMNGTIIYRDLKPENIIIRKDGRLKLVDLGCACLLEHVSRSRAGTPGYAAPEQMAAPQYVAECSDIFAWGKVMGELLKKCTPKKLQEYILVYKVKGIVKRCCNMKKEGRPIGMRMLLQDIYSIKTRK